jgi:hypothetical protein
MKEHKWWWSRHTSGPLPTYLQPIRHSGRLRFDPTLQTAGEVVRAGTIRLGSEVPQRDRSLHRDPLATHRQGGHRYAA